MNAQQLALVAPPSQSSGVVFINPRCLIRAEGDQRVVVVAGLPVYHYSVDDAVAEAYAMVSVVDSGFAKQKEVSQAFCCSARTLRRHQRRYAEGGMAALATRSGWRPGRRRIANKRLRLIAKLSSEGLSNYEIARRLGVTENAIRTKVGPKKESVQEVLSFPQTKRSIDVSSSKQQTGNISDASEQPVALGSQTPAQAPCQSDSLSFIDKDPIDENDEPAPMSLDKDPTNRIFDRLLACFGLIDDAAPVFCEAADVPGAGVLFAPGVTVRVEPS